MSTVSVIIPTWNRAHTLGAAVKSVLEQTHPVLEILVCDDGSTDHTEQVLASFNDPRIRIVKGPRAGRPAVPRNRGIAEATGDWVAFLDSDDTWLPTKTEKQLNALSHAHAMIACCNAWKVLPGKGRVSAYLDIPATTFTLPVLLKTNYVICSSVMVRRELVASLKGFPEDENLRAIEDFALWLRIAALAKIVYLDEPLVEYMDDALNSIRVGAKENQQREKVMENFYAWFTEAGLTLYKTDVRKAVKLAMKNNGRSFTDRWKVK